MQGQGNRMFALGKQACSRLRVAGDRLYAELWIMLSCGAERPSTGAGIGRELSIILDLDLGR